MFLKKICITGEQLLLIVILIIKTSTQKISLHISKQKRKVKYKKVLSFEKDIYLLTMHASLIIYGQKRTPHLKLPSEMLTHYLFKITKVLYVNMSLLI